MIIPVMPKEVYPILAWRAFKYYSPGYLGDVGGSHVYEPKKAWESSCRARGLGHNPLLGFDHLAPDPSCTCGFWSFKEKEQIVEQGYNTMGLIGEVWLWGRIVECENGYRSQYMYVNSLTVTKPFIEAEAPWLGDLYGVPCDIDLEFGTRNWFREHPPNIDPNKPTRPPSKLPYNLADLWKIVLESDDYYLRRDARNRLRSRLVNERNHKTRVVALCKQTIIRHEARLQHINNGMVTLERVKQVLNRQRTKMRRL